MPLVHPCKNHPIIILRFSITIGLLTFALLYITTAPSTTVDNQFGKQSDGHNHKRTGFMSQSIPTGYIPRAIPGKIFLSERIPVTRAIFCLIPCPGAINDGRISEGGAKFSQTRRNCSLSLEKILKTLRKL